MIEVHLMNLGHTVFAWLDLDTGGEQIRRLSVMVNACGMSNYSVTQMAIHTVARQVALAILG